jgi:hypothetical protein
MMPAISCQRPKEMLEADDFAGPIGRSQPDNFAGRCHRQVEPAPTTSESPVFDFVPIGDQMADMERYQLKNAHRHRAVTGGFGGAYANERSWQIQAKR